MATLVLIMTHAPEQCPSANSTIRKLTSNVSTDVPKVAKKHGVRFMAGPLVTNEHRMFAVVESDKVENVNEFLTDTALLQWNSIEIIPAQPIEEGLKQIGRLTPIY